MDFFASGTILVLLFYIPGYIFVCTKDYFLLKRQKSQFEKTVQGFVASIFLLLFFCFSIKLGSYLIRILTGRNEKLELLLIIRNYSRYVSGIDIKDFIELINNKMILLYLFFVVFSFLSACLYAEIRRSYFVKEIVELITRRDYYDKVEFGFFDKYINTHELVSVSFKNSSMTYLGYLDSAPDNDNDSKIVLAKPCIAENNKIISLATDFMLIDLNCVDKIIHVKKNK